MTRQEIMLNEYRNRIEVADKVLSETREKLTKAEHDRDRYKAEIERLKAEYEKLQTNAEILARGVRDLNHENYELTEKIKQAKIDVLNELKDKMFEREYMGVKYKERIFYESEINEMIAEVQNA